MLLFRLDAERSDVEIELEIPTEIAEPDADEKLKRILRAFEENGVRAEDREVIQHDYL